MKKIVTLALILFGFVSIAQTTPDWSALQPSVGQPNLEFNPLRGLAANFNTNNEFPYSIRSVTYSYGQIVNDNGSINFGLIDNILDEEAQKGHFTMLQINIDDGKLINPINVDLNGSYPGDDRDLPDFLNSVERLYYLGNTSESVSDPEPSDANQNVFPLHPTDTNGNPSIVVNYNNPQLITALVDLITQLGAKYDDDDRLFIVHFGIYGIFGEFGLGSGKEYIPNVVDENGVSINAEVSDWEMTEGNLTILSNAYQNAFTETKLVSRNAEVPEPQNYGFSDGLYFGGSISAVNNPFFFLPGLELNNAGQNWKSQVIGGEMDPWLQGYIWPNDIALDISDARPFGNVVHTGDPDKTSEEPQNVEDVFLETHPTFVFQNYMFQTQFAGLNSSSNHGAQTDLRAYPNQGQPNANFWNNALLATKKMGYTFHIDEFNLSAQNGITSVEVNIKNTGVAPMYANWDIELAYVDDNNTPNDPNDDTPISLGTTSTWNLSSILPEIIDGTIANPLNKRALLASNLLENNTEYTFLIRIVNPLINQQVLSDGTIRPAYPLSSKPVRFDNATQDEDLDGWLTLGTGTTDANGNFGVFPQEIVSFTTTDALSQTMFLQDELQLSATIDPSTVPFYWSSNLPQIASVDTTGKVTSFNLTGNVIIKAATADGQELNFEIDVQGFRRIPNLGDEVIEAETANIIVFDNGTTNDDARPLIISGGEDDGQTTIGFIQNNDIFEFPVNVAAGGGDFQLDIRVLTTSGFRPDARIAVERHDGDPANTTVLIQEFIFEQDPNSYGTVTTPTFQLPEGNQFIRLRVLSSAFDLNWIKFNEVLPVFIPIPNLGDTVIEAEDYNTIDAQNIGVQAIEFGNDVGGFNLGGFQVGDRLGYNVAVAPGGADFEIDFRVSGNFSDGAIRVLDANNQELTLETFARTNDFNLYDTYTSNVFSLPEGNLTITLEVVATNFNLNWIKFKEINGPTLTIIGIDETVVIEGDFEVIEGARIEIRQGGSLTVNGNLTINGEIKLTSVSDKYSSLIVNGTSTGNITYKRHVNSFNGTTGNDLISLPTSNQNFDEFAANNPNIYENPNNTDEKLFGDFNEQTGEYAIYNINSGNNRLLEPGKGYKTARDGSEDAISGSTFIFEGESRTNAIDVLLTDTQNSNFRGWNLIGNPYSAYLDFDSFFELNNEQLEDGALRAVYGYDGNAQDGWEILNFTTTGRLIAPGQGFFVKSRTNGGTITFTPDMRRAGQSDDFILNRSATEAIYHLKLNLSAGAELRYDTNFYFNAVATSGLDSGYDAAIFNSEPASFSIYSELVENNSGQPLAIQALNQEVLTNVSIPLGVNAPQGQEIRFNIEESNLPSGINVYLVDMASNLSTLLNQSDYILTPQTNLDGVGRFYLRLEADALGLTESSFEDLNIYTNYTNKTLVISGLITDNTKFTLFDMNGREVLQEQLETKTSTNVIDISHLPTGIYILNLGSDSNIKRVEKLVIK